MVENKWDGINRVALTAIAVAMLNIVVLFTVGIIHNDMVYKFAIFLGQKVNVVGLVAGNLFVMFLFWRKKQYKMIGYLLLANALVAVVSTLLKLGFSDWLNMSFAHRPSGGERGFPSGHSTHAYAVAFFVHLFAPQFKYLAYAVAFMITWGRLETMVHTELQLIAGMVLGIGLSFWYWRLILKRNNLCE